MITLFIDYGPALLAWVAVLYRVTILRRPVESQGLRGYWFGLLALALAATVLLPPIYLAFDDLVGVRNLARLLAHSLVLVSSWCVQVYLYYLTYTDSRAGAGTRRSACVLVVALALMAACFAQVHVGEDAFNFSGHYASAPLSSSTAWYSSPTSPGRCAPSSSSPGAVPTSPAAAPRFTWASAWLRWAASSASCTWPTRACGSPPAVWGSRTPCPSPSGSNRY